jgi:hypothetical protein
MKQGRIVSEPVFQVLFQQMLGLERRNSQSLRVRTNVGNFPDRHELASVQILLLKIPQGAADAERGRPLELLR